MLCLALDTSDPLQRRRLEGVFEAASSLRRATYGNFAVLPVPPGGRLRLRPPHAVRTGRPARLSDRTVVLSPGDPDHQPIAGSSMLPAAGCAG